MKTFTSGWVFLKPDQNYFKKFIQLNRLAIAGIVYPKKAVPAVEGIPVLDFDDARAVIQPGDLVLDISANPELRAPLAAFFDALDVRRVGVADYLDGLITADADDALLLPVAGIKASDIRHLKQVPAPVRFDAHFLDPETYAVASSLDGIFRHSAWEQLIAYDRDNAPGPALLAILLDLHTQGCVRHLRVLDTPRVFLDAILKLKLQDAKADFTVSVSDQAFAELGGRAEFYRRSLGDCIVPGDSSAARDDRSIVLAGSPGPVVAASAGGPIRSAICFLPRSIIDYVVLKDALGDGQYKILLRQPDTMAHNLLAAVLTPALFDV